MSQTTRYVTYVYGSAADLLSQPNCSHLASLHAPPIASKQSLDVKNTSAHARGLQIVASSNARKGAKTADNAATIAGMNNVGAAPAVADLLR